MTGEEQQRDKWANKIEFLLATIGAAVGYGNVWRFPYMCYQYGGAAFLIPYLCALLFAGVPVFAIEVAVGQFSSFGCNKVFEHMAPIFHGIGWGSIVVSLIVAVYFNMLIAWSLYYLWVSFRKVLPWTGCMNEWNTDKCYSNLEDQRCRSDLSDPGAMFYNQSCHTSNDVIRNGINDTILMLRHQKDCLGDAIDTEKCRENIGDPGAVFFNSSCWSSSEVLENGINKTIEFVSNTQLTAPSDEYFFRGVLMQSKGFEDMGQLRWHLVLAQIVAWLLVFACIFNGIKSSGKVVYFTVTAPYVLITVLLIRGVTLDGAGDGLRFYLIPNMTKLLSIEIWRAAAVQIFYTYGVAFGVIITFASYNKFNSNVLRDAFFICCTDSLTSFYSGFAVFSTAGFMAKALGRNVDDIIQQGTGLAFVVFPEALARMPWSSLFSVIFFLMMILIGIDSQFTMIECPATAIMDELPVLRRFKPLVFFVICFVLFLLGLPICMDGGLYVFTLINDWTAGWCIMLLCLCELFAVVCLYGVKRFMGDIELMSGQKSILTWSYWVVCWCILTPTYLTFILIKSVIDTVKYSSSVGSYEFPSWATAIGWGLSFASIIMVPIFAVYQTIRHLMLGIPLHRLFQPTDQYCPAEQRNNKHVIPMTLVTRRTSPAYSNPVYGSGPMKF